MRLTLPLVCLAILFSSISFSQDTLRVDTSKAIFERVEVEATFPEGESGWRRFLERNLNASAPVDNGAPCGQYTVYAQFIVDRDGMVSEVKALTKMGYGMEQEVVRIIKKSGLWTPAIQKGKPVRAYRKQPVSFMVQQEDFNIFTKTPYVLYVGQENELNIEADKLKADNMELEISEGSIAKNEDGKFVALVKKPGRVVITVYNKKKRSKPVGAMSFEVRAAN